MTQSEKMKQVGEELGVYIDRMCMEYSMTLAEMVGVLEVGKYTIMKREIVEVDDE